MHHQDTDVRTCPKLLPSIRMADRHPYATNCRIVVSLSLTAYCTVQYVLYSTLSTVHVVHTVYCTVQLRFGMRTSLVADLLMLKSQTNSTIVLSCRYCGLARWVRLTLLIHAFLLLKYRVHQILFNVSRWILCLLQRFSSLVYYLILFFFPSFTSFIRFI